MLLYFHFQGVYRVMRPNDLSNFLFLGMTIFALVITFWISYTPLFFRATLIYHWQPRVGVKYNRFSDFLIEMFKDATRSHVEESM